MRHEGIRRRRWNGRRRVLGVIPVLFLVVLMTTGCTKLTGGGWIPAVVPTQKATFGFTAKCKTVTMSGLPAAVLFEGQFEYTDPSVEVNVHGDVQPFEFQTVVGMTCKQLAASEPDVLGLGQFAGTFRTQSATGLSSQGEVLVQVADGGKPHTIDGDALSVELVGDGVGGLLYHHEGVVQGGNIRVE